jgi:uncharacterized membrane protein YgdD (TMEM256/DUF423 family)
METKWTQIAAISMAIAVALGALGAHTLKDILSPESLASFETGVRYHTIHSLALLLLSGITFHHRRKNLIFSTMFYGMLMFSGSIYLLSTRSLFSIGEQFSILGPVTPIGGLMLMSSWLILAFGLKSEALDHP